ncbi:MAG: hypothetical protein ACYS8W_20150 [Planctomycetota bacterium]|jgi:hypothetical protein
MSLVKLVSLAIGIAVFAAADSAGSAERLLARTDGDGAAVNRNPKNKGMKLRVVSEKDRNGKEEERASLGLLGMNRKMKRIPDLEPGMNIPLWPYSQKRNELEHSTSIFWPLFHTEKSKYGESFTYSFPLFWNKRRRDDSGFTSIFPLYFSTSDGKGNGSTLIAPPLFSKIKRSDKDNQYSFIYPLFGWRKAPGHTQYDLFPAFYRHHEINRLRPFYKERKELFGTSFAKPPEFMRDVERDDYFVLFPLFWRFRTRENTYTHLWPLFGYDKFGRKGRRYSFIFPLYFYTNRPDEGYTSYFLFPFSYSRQMIKDAKGIAREARQFSVFPVFQYARTPTMVGSSFLFGSFYNYQNNLREGEGEFSLLILLHRRYWTKDSTSHWYAAPLFRYMRNDKDSWKSFSFLAFPHIQRFPSTRRWHLFGVGAKKDDFFLEFHPVFQYKVEKGLSRFHILYGLFGLYKERPEGKPNAEPIRRVRIFWFFSF